MFAIDTRTGRPLKRVLIVDDDEELTSSLVTLLSGSGISSEVMRPEDLPAALQLLEPPSAVLVDPYSHSLDGGLRFCKEARTTWGVQTRFVALSVWDDERHREDAESAGFDAYLLKPAPFGDIASALGVTV